MKRREFLSLSAISVAAVPGCAHLPPPAADVGALAMVTDVLDQLDHNIRTRLHTGPEVAEADRPLLGAVEDVLSGLAVYTAFLELPLAHQVHPGVQERILRAGRNFWRGAKGLRELLGNGSATLMARMEEARQALAGREVDFMALLEGEARTVGVRGLGRRRFNSVLRRAMRMMDDQDAPALARSLARRLDELDEEADRSLAASSDLDARTVQEVTEAVEAWGALGFAPSATCAAATKSDRIVLTILGISFIAVGGVLIIVGLALVAALPECWCLGGLVALIGIGMLIPGIIILVSAMTAKTEPVLEPTPAVVAPAP